MTIRYDEAMHHAYAGRQYGCVGPNYEDINWFESEPKPTKEELEAVWAEIKADIELREVYRNRSMAYPAVEELTVALWDQLVEGGTLTSDAIAAIEAKRQQVKEDFPK
jgi:hypothetical protein